MIRSKEFEVLLVGCSRYSTSLLKEDYHVTEYNSHAEAVKGLIFRMSNQFHMPSVIVTDYGKDEPAYVNLLRLSQPKNIPLLVIDKEYSESRKQTALRLHVSDYIDENVRKDKVLLRIKTIARLARANEPKAYSRPQYNIPLAKRLFDIAVSGTLLLLLSPLFLIIMLAIRLESKGPVFYWQPRVGSGYRVFKFHKFRSMRVNADQLVDNLKGKNHYNVSNTELPEFEKSNIVLVGDNTVMDEEKHLVKKEIEEKNSFFKIKNDPRITKVGHFIRNTSIDELPQLFNVFIGDMSIVGNRPLPLYEAEKLTDDSWSERFMAPAGITGLWQVTERGKANTSEESRKQLDIEYARTYSFWMDMKILFKTPLAALQSENV